MNRFRRFLLPALILGAVPGLMADSSSYVRASITVVGKDGKPIAGVKVTIRRTDTGWKKEYTTDAKGNFISGGIPSSANRVFEVTASKDGYSITQEMTDFPLQTETLLRKEFTLYKPSEAPAGQPGAATPVAAAPADDPAAKSESDARKAFNDTALPLVQAGKYADALPILDKAYKDMNDALPQIKDAAEKDELEKTVLPLVEKTYGLSLFQAGKKEDALPYLEKVVVREPKNANILTALVQGYAAKKDKANESKYQAMLDAVTGPRPDAAYNKGVEAFNKGRMKEAKDHLHKAIEIDPNFADAYYLLGMVEYGNNNLAGAKAHFRKYLELAPTGSHAADVKDALAGM
ncbi:MAG TPA: tetratricopeptide repeat protein [Holophagaceae bacterium]|nr:tetratricopeptide repeat protein [Holophagaceae bacterium]